jgi:hypothetical protein
MPKLPIKKPGALPAVKDKVTEGVLDKLPTVDRREFLRGALSTLADTSALGKVADVVAPAVKAIPKLPENIFQLDSFNALVNRTMDNIANKIMEDPYEELGARGVKNSEIEEMIESEQLGIDEITKAADGLAEWEAEDAVRTVFKGNSENLERFFETGNEKVLISDDYADIIRELRDNYNLNFDEIKQYLIDSNLYKTE